MLATQFAEMMGDGDDRAPQPPEGVTPGEIAVGIEKKSRVLCKEERRRIADHEMGHALVASSLPGVDPVQKVSIIPRGVGAPGYTMQRPTEDRFLLAASELKNRIAVLIGGRASKRLIFDGDVSTGRAGEWKAMVQSRGKKPAKTDQ